MPKTAPKKAPGKSPAKRRLHLWFLAGVLAIACVFAYDPSRMENSSGDTISARYWPVAILKHHTYTLNPFARDLNGVGYAAIYSADGRWLPRNGWGIALYSVPFYAIADAFNLGGTEWTHDRIGQVSRWNAIVLATGSVIALFFLLLKFTSPPLALASSALFAFGTWNWSLAPQGLFTQTAAVLTHMFSLLLLWRVCTLPADRRVTREAILLGILHGLIWSLRPQDCVLLLPTALVLRERAGLKGLIPYFLAGCAVVLPMMELYRFIYHDPIGAYGVVDSMGNKTWRWNFIAGFLGLLFSPNKGAIVFFPLLLLVPLFWRKYMPRFEIRRLLYLKRLKRPTASRAAATRRSAIPETFSDALALGAALYFAMLCFVIYWHGTWAFGSRYLYDMLPYVWPAITLALGDAAVAFLSKPRKKPKLPRWALALTLVFAAAGVFVHGLGNRNYDIYVWSRAVVPVNDEKAWSLKELFLVDLWKAGSNKHRWSSALQRLKEYGF